MHILLWLAGLWVATVLAIWRVMYVLDQPPQRKRPRANNVIPFPTADSVSWRARAADQGVPLKKHGTARPYPYRRY